MTRISKRNRTRGALFGGFYGRRFRKPGLMDPALQGLPAEDAREIARAKQARKEAMRLRSAKNKP